MADIDSNQIEWSGKGFEHHLNPRFTFEEFVSGTNNRFPYAAARAVTENSGADYNPLFLCSEWQVGKTHLLHAIGNSIQSTSPQSLVLLTSKKSFTGELISAIRNECFTEMRNHYLEVDILLFDDLTFIAGEEFVVEAFYLFVCDLVDKGKQVVITCGSVTNNLKRFVGRLRKRCANSLIADFDPLDFESKLANLKYDADELGSNIPGDVMLYLAQSLSRRCDLNGCIKWLLVQYLFNDKKIDLSLGEQYVKSVCDKDGTVFMRSDVSG